MFRSRGALTHGRAGRHGLLAIPLLGTLLAAFALMAYMPRQAAADGPSLGVDANPGGNEPDHLESLDSCVSVSPGDSFSVDVTVEDVQDLLAWEVYFEYDPAIVEVTSAKLDMFQAANSGSSVYDVSERLPVSDGSYRLGAADTADPPSPDSGSGVLARLTLRALGPGESPLALPSRDLDGDSQLDVGPFLRNVAAEIIGDSNDDTLFDGPVKDAIVAVDRPCPLGSTTPGPATVSSGDSSDNSVYIWALAIGAAVLAAVTVTVLLFRRRLRAQVEKP